MTKAYWISNQIVVGLGFQNDPRRDIGFTAISSSTAIEVSVIDCKNSGRLSVKQSRRYDIVYQESNMTALH